MKKTPLPSGLRARKQNSGTVYYYLKTDPALRELPLGRNLQGALAVWQQHRIERYVRESSLSGILNIIDCFRVAGIPVRDASSRAVLVKQVTALEGYFIKVGNPGPGQAMPDAGAYLEHRGAQFRIRAGAEVRLLVHIWAWAVRHSLVAVPCPWTSETVADNFRKSVQKEIGDALRYYYAHHHSNAAHGIPQRIAGAPASAPWTCDSDVLEWARGIAKLLRDDGRKDLARGVRKLSAGELRTLLAMPVEREVKSGELILGTQRSTQLAVLQRTREVPRATPGRNYRRV